MENDNLYSLPLNLNFAECYYKGEGNANLVIALRNEQKVIRIPKHEEDDSEGKYDSRIKVSLVYLEKIVLPLFSAEYFELPKLARINEQQIHNLNEVLSDVRPTFRQHKIIKPGYVTVYEDLTLLSRRLSNQPPGSNDIVPNMSQNPVFCVELKPKQGWLAPTDRKFKKCSFCLNQFMKLSDSSIQSTSNYCPLDLFSGVEARMMKAMTSLLATPQNNLRIFQNGNLVFGDGVPASIEDVLIPICSVSDKGQMIYNFCNLIFNLLTKNKSHEKDNFPCTTNEIIQDEYENVKLRIPTEDVTKLNALLSNTKLCDFSSAPLPVNSILDKILKIQKLDTFGADYVYKYYKSIQETRANENIDVCQSLVHHFPTGLNPIENYLLSTMAKDCSIMIAFQKVDNLPLSEESGFIIEDLVKNKFLYQVNVADVDAKPIQCIDKHYQRDNRIVKAALHLLEIR